MENNDQPNPGNDDGILPESQARDAIDRWVPPTRLDSHEHGLSPQERIRLRKALWGWALALLALLGMCGTLGILFYRWCRPASKVDAVIYNAPPKSLFVWMVRETPDGPELLSLIVYKVGPVYLKPEPGWRGGFQPTTNGSFESHNLDWQAADRYGVLAEVADGQWRLWWLTDDDIAIRGRPWIVGGGEVQVVLPPESSAEIPSADLLRRLKLPPTFRPNANGDRAKWPDETNR